MLEKHSAFACACALSVIFILFSCSKSEEKQKKLEEERIKRIENAKNEAINGYIKNLSDDVKISQIFLVNIEGNEKYYSVEKNGILSGNLREGEPLVPGGVLLFSYNIAETPEGLFSYIKSIHEFYKKNGIVPPYVAVDQEGGYVNRLRSITSPLPSQLKISENYTADESFSLYKMQAEQMHLLGINMNLAPVIEVLDSSNEKFLETRTFGSLENVLEFGRNCVFAYENSGIAAVLKHFPGNTNVDPHTGLPKIHITAQNKENFLLPFRTILPSASAVLMSHAVISVEEEFFAESDDFSSYSAVPACFSEFWNTSYIRNELGFTGLIFSDDIFMSALSQNGFPPETAAVRAIEAGVDCIMLSEKKFGSVARILLEKSRTDEEFAAKLNRAVFNVIKYKVKAGLLLLESEILEDGTQKFTVKQNEFTENFDSEKFESLKKAATEILK